MFFKTKTCYLSILEGGQKWIKFGQYKSYFHRDSGPANINFLGDRYWFKNGEVEHIIWHDYQSNCKT